MNGFAHKSRRSNQDCEEDEVEMSVSYSYTNEWKRKMDYKCCTLHF